MMLMGGPKKLAAIIVSSKKMESPKSSVAMEILQKMKEPKPIEMKPKEAPEEVDAYKEAVLSQAKMILKAIKSEDPEKFGEYLQNFISMCSQGSEMEDEGEEEGES
jgi:hypothetical protein